MIRGVVRTVPETLTRAGRHVRSVKSASLMAVIPPLIRSGGNPTWAETGGESHFVLTRNPCAGRGIQAKMSVKAGLSSWALA